MCAPSDKLNIYRNYEITPSLYVSFVVSPNYELITNEAEVNATVNYFVMSREQMNLDSDLSIVDKSPLRMINTWSGFIQL